MLIIGTVLPPGAIGDRAMASTLCDRGWHQLSSGGAPFFVRFGSRLRDKFGTYVYQVGPKPKASFCRVVWCYGDRGQPWQCVACLAPIDGARPVPALAN